MKSLGFGLVGYGAWGMCHARAIARTPGCRLEGICAVTEETRERAARETGATTFRDYHELVAQPNLDVIDVVLPNHLHEAVARAALDKGKHVLLEKPMSTSVASCDRIIEAAQKAGRILLVGHEMRSSAMYLEMRRLIASGALGKPRYVLVDLWRRPYRPGRNGWRRDPERVGSWTLEEPVHFFDAAAWFLEEAGEPVALYARGNQSDPAIAYQPSANDNFTAVFSYANGAYAAISQTLAAVEHHLTIKFIGSQAFARAEWHAELDRSEHPSYSLEISENGHMRSLEVEKTPGELFELREEIAALARAVRDGAPLPITPHEARRAVMLCLEAERSLETGEAVRL